jgi:Do/DeqQ family serine protease
MNVKNWVAIVLVSMTSGFVGSWIFRGNSGNTVVLNTASENSNLVPSRVASSGMDLNSFEKASAASTPSVVFIKTISTVQYESPFDGLFWDFDPFGSRGKASSTGSGVIVNSNGYIVTNNHVIQGAESISVVLNKGKKEYVAKVVGTDPGSDLALIKIEATELPAAVIGNSDQVNVGEWVLAVGNPFNLNSTVTAGIVSAKGRNINIVKNQFPIESFIQTDAAINPGNSGGALVNLRGELIGINTAIQSNTGSYTGYGFAIPSNIVKKIITDLIEKGEVLRAFSGMEVGALSSDETQKLGVDLNGEPLKIKSILEDGPAEKSGLKAGDVLVKIGDQSIDGQSSYDEFMAYQRPGNKIGFEVIRAGKLVKGELVLISQSANKELLMKGVVSSSFLGADFQPLSASDKSKFRIESGIRIINIRRSGGIAQMGLPNGFVVVKFNGKSYEAPEDLIAAMEGSSGKMQIQGLDPNGSSRSYSFYRY